MAQKIVTIAPVTITTAGTRVQINNSSQRVTSILIQADPDNTGKIYIGDSSVSATNGTALNPRESYSLDPKAVGKVDEELVLSDFWVDSQTSGNKVRVSYLLGR